MNQKTILVLALLSSIPAVILAELPVSVAADRLAVDNKTHTLVATGHVDVVVRAEAPRGKKAELHLRSERVAKEGELYSFADDTAITTCTNAPGSLHWCAKGAVELRTSEGENGTPVPEEVTVRDASFSLFGVPLAWMPYFWYPFNTDYGWRITPGYSSRWGAYALSKYVYNIAGSFDPGEFGLSGATRFDLRSENGVALGQSVKWQLGDFGKGKFKVYYADDKDADRYDSHRSTRRWNYANWGSKVPEDRYGLMLEHRWDPTERDVVRLKGAYFSDSHFYSDFLNDAVLKGRNRFLSHEGNELAWEHLENDTGLGLSVSGPLNDFYSGVSRLPEFYIDVNPQSVFSLPVNYESSTRLGWLNRDYGKHGLSSATSDAFRYSPGRWADYQCFRFDTYHRFTAPFKVADVLSVVPRFGVRGTYWSETGYENLDGRGKAGKTGDDTWRGIVEGGVTFAARATKDFDGGWRHVFEPYADVLVQEANYSGLSRGTRQYIFDSVDASRDWLDQFAGSSRELPYSWRGVTPGVRNAFRHTDGNGRSRTVFDFDAYVSLQFNDTDYTEGNKYHRLASKSERTNYGRSNGVYAMPGLAARLYPHDDCALIARAEYDTQNDTLAYAALTWRQKVTDDFNYDVSFFQRDHRWWDYSSTPYDAEAMKNEDFNWARFSYLRVGFEQDICDALAWGPYIIWDFRESELDEVGTWFDYRTDCLGFRFELAYENDYERLDRTETKDDWRCGFYIYLRALGPGSGRFL